MACQLTLEERERISQMRFARVSNAEIARQLDRHPTTIGRELARNSGPGQYSAVTAQRLADARRKQRPLQRKLDRPEVNAYVRQGLARRWSPDQIAGRSKADFADRSQRVSPQLIYSWIEQQGAEREHWRQLLRRGGRRRPKTDARGRIPGQVCIEGRPAIVDRRERFGDWEGDTMIGGRHSGALVTMVERKSGYLLAAKAKDRQSRRVCRKIDERLVAFPDALRRTMTFDNGKEFSQHQWLAERTGLAIYFAHPYRSWERGTIENTNGLLRQFFPKGTDFRSVSWQSLDEAEQSLNDRPRKRLGYRTPREVLHTQFPHLKHCN
jgi:transposase, IS30 family